MPQFAIATAETAVDLTQAPGLGELAEKHRDKVVPTGEALGTALAAGLADELGEAVAVNQRKKLAE